MTILKIIWAIFWRLGLLAAAVGLVLYIGVVQYGWIPGGPKQPVKRPPVNAVSPRPSASPFSSKIPPLNSLADELSKKSKELLEKGSELSDTIGKKIDETIGGGSTPGQTSQPSSGAKDTQTPRSAPTPKQSPKENPKTKQITPTPTPKPSDGDLIKSLIEQTEDQTPKPGGKKK